jgi:hypothetical protein
MIVLAKSELDRICKYKSVFQKAEKYTGVPWQAIAAIWWRESGSVTPPKTPGGPLQFDPAPRPSALKALLDKFTTLSEDEKMTLISAGVNDFQAAAVFCACWLRMKVTGKIAPDAPDDLIKDAFYGYNGRAYGSVEKSPYVMNGFDNDGLMIKGSVPDGKGGRKQITPHRDKRPGTFVVYKQLKGEMPNIGS